MICNFQKQFVERVKLGKKDCTIREVRNGKKRWRKGMAIQCQTGSRYKSVRFLVAEVLEVADVEIDAANHETVKVDGILIPHQLTKRLAVMDGFLDVQDFMDYFYPKVEDPITGPEPFKGQWIIFGPKALALLNEIKALEV
jgi:hypothetical protein